jgi:membrane protease subunit HflK
MQETVRETFINMLSYLRWIILCLVVLYLFSGIYSISSNEIGVLQRFGKAIEGRVQPGIHYALPWPIDRVTKVPVRIIKRILIDDFYSESSLESIARVFSGMTGLGSYCVTGDNNLVNIICVIQFNITNPFDYLFEMKQPDIMLRSMACNTIIHCLSRMSIDEALTRGKQEIANYIKVELQKGLDNSKSGLGISFVELREIKPPDRVEQFFSDVVKAKIDRGKMINEAESYRNEKIPAAKADATRILQEAEAYKREVFLRAEGEVDRFKSLLKQVREKGDSARNMIYIETIKEIMKKVEKKRIVVRDKTGKVPARIRLYFPP